MTVVEPPLLKFVKYKSRTDGGCGCMRDTEHIGTFYSNVKGTTDTYTLSFPNKNLFYLCSTQLSELCLVNL